MQIISYDFDGVLHLDVSSFLGLINYPSLKNRNNPEQLAKKTNTNITNQIKKECKQYDIYIVTSRPPSHKKTIEDFLKLVGIDKCIKKIILIGIKSKSAILNKYNIVRHYDDSLIIINEIIRNSPNIEIIKVYPFHGGVFKKYKSKNSFPTLYDILLIFLILCSIIVLIYLKIKIYI